MVWTLVGVVGFALVVIFLRDHRVLTRYGYACRTGPVWCCCHSSAAAGEVLRRRDGARSGFAASAGIQPAEFSKILLLIFFAAVLVAKRNVFTTAENISSGWTFPARVISGRCSAAWIISVGSVWSSKGSRYLAAALRIVPRDGLHRH